MVPVKRLLPIPRILIKAAESIFGQPSASPNPATSIIPRGAIVLYRKWYGASSANVGLKLTAEELAHGIIGKSGDEGYAYIVVDPSMLLRAEAHHWPSA